jgi:hypothetical protein
MRIYSKTLLTWPLTIHVSQAARIYPGKWHNYSFYLVKLTHPTIILHSYSPLEFLEENSPFYCYERYYRNESLELFGNKKVLASIQNNKYSSTENYIYVPKNIAINDIIAV